MGRLNIDPIWVFADGSQLLISTQHSGEGRFTCGLYVGSQGPEDRLDFREVTGYFESSTCLEAQESAYRRAQSLYPDTAEGMKKPPYLIWAGPQSAKYT